MYSFPRYVIFEAALTTWLFLYAIVFSLGKGQPRDVVCQLLSLVRHSPGIRPIHCSWVLAIFGSPPSLHLVPPLTGKGRWCCDVARAGFRQTLDWVFNWYHPPSSQSVVLSSDWVLNRRLQGSPGDLFCPTLARLFSSHGTTSLEGSGVLSRPIYKSNLQPTMAIPQIEDPSTADRFNKYATFMRRLRKTRANGGGWCVICNSFAMRSLLCLVSCSFSLRYPPPVLGAGDCGLQTPHAPRQTLDCIPIWGDGHNWEIGIFKNQLYNITNH